jgi:site-specific DNA-adenine methylase
MQYQGGKSRIAGKLAAVIRKWLPNVEEIYEPFCGGGAMSLAFAKAGFMVRASDIHEDLILMWQAVMSTTLDMSSVSEAEYTALKYSEPSARRGFVGFGNSFGGGWWSGFARHPYNIKRNTAQETARNISRLIGLPITFTQHDYQSIPSLAAAYCDPPYRGTKPYPGQPPFDHNAFWNWVENRRGPTFISEIEAPDTAQCIWQQVYKGQANNSDNTSLVAYRTRTERLFYYPGTFATQPAPMVPPCPA